jgi:hypothetical protein
MVSSCKSSGNRTGGVGIAPPLIDCGNNALLKRAAAEEVMKNRLKGIYNITGRKGGVTRLKIRFF